MNKILLIAAALAVASPSPVAAPKPSASAKPQKSAQVQFLNTKGAPVFVVTSCRGILPLSNLSNIGELAEQCGMYFPGSIVIEMKGKYYTVQHPFILVHAK